MALEGNDHDEILRRLREHSVPLTYNRWASLCRGIPVARRSAPYKHYMAFHFGPGWKTQLKDAQQGGSPGRPATDPGIGTNVDGFDPGSLLAGRPGTGARMAHGTPSGIVPVPASISPPSFER